MKNFCLALLFCGFGVIAKAQSDTAAFKIIGKEIQKKFAPDKRTVFLNTRFKGDSVYIESTSEQVLQEFAKVMPTMRNIKTSSTFCSVLIS